MKNKIKLLPLLFYYSIVVLILYSNNFWGDESRYIMYANNLLNGHYSPVDDVYLWNGPGYPIILVPFIFFKLPWLTAKLLNALFLFMAILYFYSTLRLYIKERNALFYTYILGLYPPFLRYVHQLFTEPAAVFMVCGFMFHFCKAQRDNSLSWPHLLAGSFFLGYLALTKIFFGYVILAGLLLFLFLYLWKKRLFFRKTFLIYLLALIFCLPYLFYTHSLTGKIYFWGNSGGMSWYWMSTPYDNELGDWQWTRKVIDNPQLYEKHQEFFKSIENLSNLQQDDEFRKRAIENIINHPSKYLKNVLANVGRLLFNYPFSHEKQKMSTYFFMIPNMLLVVVFILCIYPAFLGRKLIPGEIYVLILFGLIALGGSSLLSAYNRQLWPIVPVFFLWISFSLTNLIEIKVKKCEPVLEESLSINTEENIEGGSSKVRMKYNLNSGQKNVLLICLASIGMFMIFIGVLEVVFRTTHMFGAAVSYTEPDPILGNRYTGGANFWFHKENIYPITGKLNSYGYRDKEWQLEKPANTYRIAVIGDSYVEALQVELEKTFLSQTEHNLNQGLNKGYKVELMNFGHSGYTQSHELIVLKNEVQKFSPDLVLLFFLPGNDIDDISKETARNLIAPFYTVSDSDELLLDTSFNETAGYKIRSFINWFKQRSTLLSFMTQRFNIYTRDRRMKKVNLVNDNKKDKVIKGYLSLCTANPDPLYLKNYNLNKRLIMAMSDYSKERGIKFILVAINMKYYIPELEKEIAAVDPTFDVNFFEDDLRDFARSHDMDYLGFQRIFRESYKKSGSALHWGHWNYKGHKVVADALTDKLTGIIQSGKQKVRQELVTE